MYNELPLPPVSDNSLAYLEHPVATGYLIMRRHTSLDAARKRPPGAAGPACLTEGIPGTSQTAYAALIFLKYSFVYGIDDGLKWAEQYWTQVTANDAGALRVLGQSYANSLEGFFRSEFETWPEHEPVLTVDVELELA